MVKHSSIDNVYSSLSDPTRRDILLKIAENSLNLQNLAKEKNISLPAISKHLKVLEKANLIQRHKVGREYKFTLLEAAKYWIEQFKNLEKFLQKDRLR